MPPQRRDFYEVLGSPGTRATTTSSTPIESSRSSSIPTATPATKRRRRASRSAPRPIKSSPIPRSGARSTTASARPPSSGGRRLRLQRRLRGLVGDLFGDFFGQPRGRGRSRARRGDDLRYNLDLSFEEAAFGCREESSRCRAWPPARPATGRAPSRAPSRRPAQQCRGSGQVRFQQGFFSHRQDLRTVQRPGQRHRRSVYQVSGAGRRAAHAEPERQDSRRRRHRLAPEAPRRRRGRRGRRVLQATSTWCSASASTRSSGARRATSSAMCPVSFPQAALGTEIEVPTLEGKQRLRVPPGTQSGAIFRLKGKGIADLHGYGRGDHIVRVVVETPRKLTKRQQRAARGVRQAARGRRSIR